jgi:hypothetical protein
MGYEGCHCPSSMVPSLPPLKSPRPQGGNRHLGPESIGNTRRRRRQSKFLQGAEADLHCDTMVHICGEPPLPPLDPPHPPPPLSKTLGSGFEPLIFLLSQNEAGVWPGACPGARACGGACTCQGRWAGGWARVSRACQGGQPGVLVWAGGRVGRAQWGGQARVSTPAGTCLRVGRRACHGGQAGMLGLAGRRVRVDGRSCRGGQLIFFA